MASALCRGDRGGCGGDAGEPITKRLNPPFLFADLVWPVRAVAPHAPGLGAPRKRPAADLTPALAGVLLLSHCVGREGSSRFLYVLPVPIICLDQCCNRIIVDQTRTCSIWGISAHRKRVSHVAAVAP